MGERERRRDIARRKVSGEVGFREVVWGGGGDGDGKGKGKGGFGVDRRGGGVGVGGFGGCGAGGMGRKHGRKRGVGKRCARG